MARNILVVEDDNNISNLIKRSAAEMQAIWDAN